MQSPDRDLAGEARQILRGLAAGRFSSSHPLPPAIDNALFDRLLQQAYGEALDGVLVEAVRRERLPLTEGQRAHLADHHRLVMAHVMRVERAAIEVCHALAAAGVEYRLLKGVALANGIYAEQEVRSFADADILLEPTGVDRGVAVLHGLGAERLYPEIRPGFDARFAKDITMRLDGIAIDLHRTLIAGPYGERIPTDLLMASSREVALGGSTLAGLDVVDAYLHAALTAGAADVPARLITLRDLLELESRPDFVLDQVLSRGTVWGVLAPLARSVQLTGVELVPDRASPLSTWASHQQSGLRDRIYMQCYIGTSRSYRRTLSTVAELPNWRSRLQFLRGILIPSDQYRRSRSWSWLGHATRGLRKLIRP